MQQDPARLNFLEFCFNEPKDSTVLDIGCGDCETTFVLAKHFSKVVAVDSNVENISNGNVKIRKADFTDDMEFIKDRSIDIVTASFVFHQLSENQISITLKNIRKLMKESGKLIFVIPNPSAFFRSFGLDDMHSKYFSERNKLFRCMIIGRNNKPTNIRYVHHTIKDYIDLLEKNGFRVADSNIDIEKAVDDEFSVKEKYFVVKAAKRV